MATVISVQNVGKAYRLGLIGGGTLRGDLQRWWARVRRQPDPLLPIDERESGGASEVIWALRDVSFEVQQGEILGIIGGNGAGKSTILKVLSQITAPTCGQVNLKGRIASLLEVGTGFHPELTGRENIYLNGAILGMRRAEIRRKFDEIVAFAEVEKFIDTPVKRYSSGMYVRLAFAVAAHLEPEILLVDEVLAVGDAAFQKRCLGKMGDVARGGRTVLFVSHNMIAMQSLCNRVVWLDQGHVRQDGDARQVVGKYLASSLSNESSSEQVWEPEVAPGNQAIRLHRIRVRPQDDGADCLAQQDPLLIEVDWWNLVPGARLHVTLHVSTDDGVLAFTTGSAANPEWSNRPLPAGLLRSTCRIPGQLLNARRYRFTLLAVKDCSTVIFRHDSGVGLDIVDRRERDGGFMGREPGAVSPFLEWQTEYLAQDPDPLPVAGATAEAS